VRSESRSCSAHAPGMGISRDSLRGEVAATAKGRRTLKAWARSPLGALSRGPRKSNRNSNIKCANPVPSPLAGEPTATQAWPTFSPEPTGQIPFIRRGYRARPARFESLGTLAAGRYCFCLCKKSNHQAHTPIRRPLKGPRTSKTTAKTTARTKSKAPKNPSALEGEGAPKERERGAVRDQGQKRFGST